MKSIEEKAELWDYYQDLVKSSGFDGVTDLLAENKRLQAIINAANAQQSPAVVVPDYKEELFQLRKQAENWSTKLGFISSAINSREISLSEKEREFPHLLIERLHTDSELLKQRSESPRITEHDAREIEDFLVEDYKREYVGQGIEAWLRSACRELLTKLNNRA